MRKTIIEPDVGDQLDVFEGSETVTELAHSNGIAVELPEYTRVDVSGIVALDERENVVAPGDVGAQTRVILETIEDYVGHFGGSMADVVRVRVYVDDVSDDEYVRVHEVRDEFFEKAHYPASTLVETTLAMEDALVEIDADAIVPDDGWETSSLE